MNQTHLGDALDHWKGSLFEFLERETLLCDFAVDSMTSDGQPWPEDDLALYARLLRIQRRQILHHRCSLNARRTDYFAEISHAGDLFLDPDTGIKTSGCRQPDDQYVKPMEIAALLERAARGVRAAPRVVVVYQHVSRRTPDARLCACIRALADEVEGAAWCAYKSSTVVMLFLSREPSRIEAIAEALRRFLGRQAERRIGSGTITADP
jgi:hypothetical protein